MIFDGDLFAEFLSLGEGGTHDGNEHVQHENDDQQRRNDIEAVKISLHASVADVETIGLRVVQKNFYHEPETSQ